MKKVTIIGYRGNMGRRYGAILDYLGIDYQGIEERDDPIVDKDSEGIIIATPTANHLNDLVYYNNFSLPILVEKPCVKGRRELEIVNMLGSPIQMINQYAWFDECHYHTEDTETRVNYYNTGSDGILWDCINIIGLAKGQVFLSNDAPVWYVKINGYLLPKNQIDTSYIRNIYNWTQNPVDGRDYINTVTKRLLDHEENQGCNRHTGKEIFIEATGKDRKAVGRKLDGN